MPTTNQVEYSVESANTGRAQFTVSSEGTFGTPVTFGASVIEGSGTVQVTGNTITVTGIDYNKQTVLITANSVCSGLSSNTTVPIFFSLRSEQKNSKYSTTNNKPK